jgi:hypothetical protein
MPPLSKTELRFQDALWGLRRGHFWRLEPLFDGGEQSPIVQWHKMGLFDDETIALAEAFRPCFTRGV